MFDFNKLIKNTLQKIHKKQTGTEMTVNDANRIMTAINSNMDNNNNAFEDTGEIKEILKEQDIQQKAHIIRLVVVCYEEILRLKRIESAKKRVDKMLEYHNQVLKFYKCDNYDDIVKYAWRDMFVDKFSKFIDEKIDDNYNDLKVFFHQYTSGMSFDKVRETIMKKHGINYPKQHIQ